MELRRIKIDASKLPRSWMLPDYHELRILPLGDLQIGAGTTDMRRLDGYIRWAEHIDARVIGMGDYPDFASPSNRMLIESIKPELYDSAIEQLDTGAEALMNEVLEHLLPLKGSYYGLVRGHHWCQFSGNKGDSTTWLANKLDTVNAGDCCMFELDFGKRLKAHIWAHHGTGSGMVSTSAMTRLEHMTKSFFANIYLMGHQSKKGVSVVPWIRQDGGKTIGTNRYLVATGSFMEGYEVGSKDPWGNPSGTYVEKKMLPPVALGAPLLMLRPMFDEGRVDINVSV